MKKFKLYCGDCVNVMRKRVTDNSVQLTVTSPPYDGLRAYNGYKFDFEAVAKELYRVTRPGGVVVWVAGDQTKNGNESGTSFRQALYFKEIGFNLHDTMIYEKAGTGACGSNLAYWQTWEYMFVFSKGKPVFNPISDLENKKVGCVNTRGRVRIDGSIKDKVRRVTPQFSKRTNIWRMLPGNNGDTGGAHPAKFPEALARDHILSWSNSGDLVLDPMCGSGTTGKMAILAERAFVGIDCSAEYVELSRKRITP